MSLPDELVEDAVTYEMSSKLKLSQESGNHYLYGLLLSLSKYDSELEEGIRNPKGRRDEVLGHLFSRIDENFPPGTLKIEYRSKSQ